MDLNCENPKAAVLKWSLLTEALICELIRRDKTKAADAALALLLTILASSGGMDTTVVQECGPVCMKIQERISREDWSGALRQALLFRLQLKDIEDLIDQASRDSKIEGTATP